METTTANVMHDQESRPQLPNGMWVSKVEGLTGFHHERLIGFFELCSDEPLDFRRGNLAATTDPQTPQLTRAD